MYGLLKTATDWSLLNESFEVPGSTFVKFQFLCISPLHFCKDPAWRSESSPLGQLKFGAHKHGVRPFEGGRGLVVVPPASLRWVNYIRDFVFCSLD